MISRLQHLKCVLCNIIQSRQCVFLPYIRNQFSIKYLMHVVIVLERQKKSDRNEIAQ